MRESTIAVFAGKPRTLTLESVEVPALQADEILVRILGCTLCGSDIHTFSGRRSVAVPTVLDHEIVGEIVVFGPDSPRRDSAGETLVLGDRVTWAIVAACGGCIFCSHELWPKCTQATKYGHERLATQREFLGGLAEYGLLVSSTAVYRLPATIPLEVACPANCATATLEAAGSLTDAVVAITGMDLRCLTACAWRTAKVRKPSLRWTSTKFGDLVPNNSAQRTRVHRPSSRHSPMNSPTGAVQTPSSNYLAAAMRLRRQRRTCGSAAPSSSSAPYSLDRRGRSRPSRLCGDISPSAGSTTIRHGTLEATVRFLSESHTRFPFADQVSRWFPLTEIQTAFEIAERGEHIRVGVQHRN